MVSYKDRRFSCTCFAEKCDRDCRTYRRFTHTESNADRIRSMTDTELEEWLTAFVCSNVAPYATARGAAKKGRLLEWLKQECDTGVK